MPKITRVGGLTDITVREVLPTVVERPKLDVNLEEPSWAGSSSETSDAKPPKTDEPETASPPKRARETGSRSRRGRAGSSSASSTDTSGPGTDG